MFDLVPLACPRWQVAHGYLQARRRCKRLQVDFPEAQPPAVAPPAVRAHQQARRLRVGLPANRLPPPPQARDRKTGGVMVLPDRDLPGILPNIVDAIGNGFAQRAVGKIVDLDALWIALRLPFLPAVLELTDQCSLSPGTWPRRYPAGPFPASSFAR